ncbi:MAG: hypothetical protein M3252_02170 [Actinomycetota bacterium]|nr:hypothetical protein [Actinomycetota bacterium]
MNEAWFAAARAQLKGKADWDDFESALVTARKNGDRLSEAAVHHLRAAVRASLPEPHWEKVFADFTASVAILADITWARDRSLRRRSAATRGARGSRPSEMTLRR